MAEYKVTLQDDTVKKLKNMLNIGTTDEEYVIEDNGVIDVDSFIDHTKINVNIGNVNVHLDEEAQLLTTQGEQIIITEEQEGDVTTYSGPRKVKVQVGLDAVTDPTQISVIVDKGVIGSTSAKITTSVKSNVDSSVIHKAIDFTIFKEDREPGVPALDLNKAECVAYYDINEVENYTEFDNIKLENIALGDQPDAVILTISGDALNPESSRIHELSGTINNMSIDDLKTLFNRIGYDLIPLPTVEA